MEPRTFKPSAPTADSPVKRPCDAALPPGVMTVGLLMKMIISVAAFAAALGTALVAPTAHASTGPTEAAYTHEPGTAMLAVRGATESENNAPALRGKWHVRATLLSRVHLGPLNNPDRTWIFKRACGNGHCVKRLLFELGAGGYEKFTLHRRNATTWEGTRRGVGV